jgi:hypothetical protein
MPEPIRANREIEGASLVSASPEKLEFDLDSIHIKPIAKQHKRGAFVCKVPTIQNYCINNVRRDNDRYMVRAFVACQGDCLDVLGYYYLALTSYTFRGDDAKHLDDASDSKFGNHESVPAVYLGMIGVHDNFQKMGIGSLMMIDAIQRTAKIAQHAGLYALTLDANDEGVAAYYRDKFEFQSFKEGKNGLEMFLPIQIILKSFPPELLA